MNQGYGHDGESAAQTARMRAVATELRRLREASGLSLAALARATHWSKSSWGRWLAGERPVPTQAVNAIATLCGAAAEQVLEAGRIAEQAAIRATAAATAATVTVPASASASAQREASRRPVPRQLPASRPTFLARERELARLGHVLDSSRDGAPLAVVHGTAGVGKTALAVRWAHLAAEHFPDGQLFADLGGFSGDGRAVDPAEVLRDFLEALGVPPEGCPARLEGLVAAYRSVVAARRVLVVLDNARDGAQVRPLLPGGPGCMTVVTSRSRMLDLVAVEGAVPIDVGRLERGDARRLLLGRSGEGGPETVDGSEAWDEVGMVDEVVDACARLPLALCLAAARIAAQPQLGVHALAVQLRDVRSRLDVLTLAPGAADIRAVLSWSYGGLPEDAAHMFRLIGHAVGPQFSLHAAASLAGRPVPDTARLLDQLVDASLLTVTGPGRYAIHDLLRAYARELADQEPAAARLRLLDHYLHSALEAKRIVCPQPADRADPAGAPGAAAGTVVEDFDRSHERAMAWCAEQAQELLAAVVVAEEHDLRVHASLLPGALAYFLDARGRWEDLIATQRVALAAAERDGDLRAQATAHRVMGQALVCLESPDKAQQHLRAAVELSRRSGDAHTQAVVLTSLSWLHSHLDDHDLAIECSTEALRLFADAGMRHEEAHAWCAIGWARARAGEHDAAVDACEQAGALYRALGDDASLAAVGHVLGQVERKRGRPDRAVGRYRDALALLEAAAGDPASRVELLTCVGDAHDEAGDPAAALQAWRQALAILDELHHPRARALREKVTAFAAAHPAAAD